MTIYAPTMSTRGWAKTPEAIIDTVFTHYVSNNPSQSYTYDGNIYSLQSAIKYGGGIMERVVDEITEGLTTMLKRYFPNGVEIDCSYNYIKNDESKVNINISGTITTSSGKQLNIVKAFQNVNSNFYKVSDISLV